MVGVPLTTMARADALREVLVARTSLAQAVTATVQAGPGQLLLAPFSRPHAALASPRAMVGAQAQPPLKSVLPCGAGVRLVRRTQPVALATTTTPVGPQLAARQVRQYLLQ